MYLKIIEVKDADGTVNQDKYNDIKSRHPAMCGEWVYANSVYGCGPFLLLWDDDSGKMLRTSGVKHIDKSDSHITVYTMNSIYEMDIIKND